MTIEQILKLHEMGYTKAEIALMQEEPKAEDPKAEDPKAEDPKAEYPKAEDPKAEYPKAEDPKAEDKTTLSLSEQLQKLTNELINGAKTEIDTYINEAKKQVQDLNVLVSTMSATDETKQDITDIIGKIIAPVNIKNK